MSVVPIEDTLKYMNEARTNPSGFANYVKKQIDSFLNNSTLPLRPGCNYATNEGKGAWTQAYAFLTKHAPMTPFVLHQGLNLAAEDHAIDMAKTGIFGHNSSDGRSFSSRIEKRCGKAYGSSGENIGSDFKVQGRNHALQTVMGLIIDDGVKSRGHRKNIFSADFKYVGIASRVQNDKIITVMDFHSNLGNSGESIQKGSVIHVGPKSHNQKPQVHKETPKINYDQPKKQPANNGWGDMDFGGGGFGGKGNVGNFGNFGGQGGQLAMGGGSGGRTVVSKSTSTKTSTKNGIKTVIKTTKLKYSDGTEQEEVDESVTQV